MRKVQRLTRKLGVGEKSAEVEDYLVLGRRYSLLLSESLSGYQAYRAYREIISTSMLDKRFDGDALNSTLPLDNHMAELLSDMAPYKSGLNLESVREISGDMIISKPVVATTSNYMLKAPEPVTTHEQENFMRMMSV